MNSRLTRGHALLTLPIVFFATFFMTPLAVMFWASVQSAADAAGSSHFTVEQYVRLFGEPYYLESLALTFGTALLVAFLTIMLSFPVSLLYWQATARGRTLMLVLLLTPFYVNVVVKVFGWKLLVGPGGPVPLDLLTGYSPVVILSILRCLPFVVLLIASALEAIDEDLLSCARVCGAGGPRLFRTIVLPLSLPGVLGGGILAFSLTTASFVIPRLVGGALGAQFMPVAMYQQMAITQNWRFGAAMGVLLLVASAATLAASARLARSAKAGRVLSDAFVQ